MARIKEPTKRVGILLSPDLHRRAKYEAARLDCTMSEVISRSLSQALANRHLGDDGCADAPKQSA